jgi:hypothetical protein
VLIYDVGSNLMLNVDSSMWINKQQNIKFSKTIIFTCYWLQNYISKQLHA